MLSMRFSIDRRKLVVKFLIYAC